MSDNHQLKPFAVNAFIDLCFFDFIFVHTISQEDDGNNYLPGFSIIHNSNKNVNKIVQKNF